MSRSFSTIQPRGVKGKRGTLVTTRLKYLSSQLFIRRTRIEQFNWRTRLPTNIPSTNNDIDCQGKKNYFVRIHAKSKCKKKRKKKEKRKKEKKKKFKKKKKETRNEDKEKRNRVEMVYEETQTKMENKDIDEDMDKVRDTRENGNRKDSYPSEH